MRHRLGGRTWSRVAVAMLGLVLGARASHAATRTYPGPAPCDTTLAACVQGADAGDRIEIVTATPIDEDITLERGLTLTAAAGVVATIGGSSTLRQVYVYPGASEPASRFELSGLVLNNATVNGDINGASGHEVVVSGCNISTAVFFGVHLTTRVPTTIEISRNTIFGASDVVQLRPAPGTVATVVGNRLSTLYTGGDTDGVSVIAHDAGDSTVNVYSNVLFDLTRDAVLVESQGQAGGTSFVNVINNTIAGGPTEGIRVAAPQFGGKVDVNVFNNIVTGVVGAGLDFPSLSVAVTIRHAYNDLFGNGMDELGGYPAGPATLALDPAYANLLGKDFRLSVGSPLRDVGLSNPLGGLPPIDADGNQRVAGGIVDFGAYEYGSTPPSTTTTTTTAPPTTSTLPCAAAPSVASVVCRLGEIQAAVDAQVPLGALRERLAAALAEARDAAVAADAATASRARRRAFGKSLKRVKRFANVLASRAARRALSEAVRAGLTAPVPTLQSDLRTLRTAG
jgi:hypothetical protein